MGFRNNTVHFHGTNIRGVSHVLILLIFTVQRREDVDRKERTAADLVVYTSVEARWRAVQLPYIALNV